MVNQKPQAARKDMTIPRGGMMAIPLSGMVRLIAPIAGLLLVVVLFIGQAHFVSAESPTFVRVVDASPDASVTSIFVGGKEIVHNFQFGTVTPYVTISAGNYRWQMAALGKGPGAAFMSEMMRCDPGVAYTIFSYGTQKTGIKFGMFQDDNALTTGRAKVRVYHLAYDTGSVNVSANTIDLTNGLTYQNASSYVVLPSGAYTFHTAGAVSSSVSDTLSPDIVESLFLINKNVGSQQVKVVTAQEKGLPTLPNTGSDPYATNGSVSVSQVSLWEILLAGVIIVGIAGLVLFGRGQRGRWKRS
ncbi:MAG: DUF4397 domain-containing protein [Ktedonobacteraceae bacterium]|nr:DUF4397 domain-containing protein [Ktedonobacteraceae bacterium]MBV9615716.1 DUF4397 domain-containing protein [Ktedonobacteraceae bacterium]MBV9712877.1 DUF4397 domain-containing protein [Ktedonobacteraceae bacterium]